MDTTLPSFLEKQFHATYDHTEWFVSFQQAVKGLTHDQAIDKINDETPSIFAIVAHLTYWNDRYLKKMKGEAQDAPMISDNDLTFSTSGYKNWEELLAKAETVFPGWCEHLAKLSENDAEHFSAIANTTAHNAYHIGQIVMIRKISGNWNSADGVK
ncbi:MAG TPA: DinB family protein [Bacteroidia bacterium]|jgi:hypothetical protein|nr:DinB family protein [Bacteroidia bacterium]